MTEPIVPTPPNPANAAPAAAPPTSAVTPPVSADAGKPLKPGAVDVTTLLDEADAGQVSR